VRAALSPDGRRALTSSRDHVAVWHVGTQMRRITIREVRGVRAARFGDDGRSIVAVFATDLSTVGPLRRATLIVKTAGPNRQGEWRCHATPALSYTERINPSSAC
jgi:hypothetical protein